MAHAWLADALRKPGVGCSPPALAQVQQELPFEITAAGLAQLRLLPLGGDKVKAQSLQLS